MQRMCVCVCTNVSMHVFVQAVPELSVLLFGNTLYDMQFGSKAKVEETNLLKQQTRQMRKLPCQEPSRREHI